MKPADQFSRRRAWLAGGLAFVVVATLAATVILRREALRRAADRTQVQLLANERAYALQRTIERAASATYALAALVRQGRGTVADFEGAAGRLLPNYPGVAALGLARDGVVNAVAPGLANQGALGHELYKDPTSDQEARRVRDTGQLTLAGPFPLRQGGEGAVARLPVLLEDARGQPVFWGFVFAVLRGQDLLASARIDRLAAAGLDYQLARLGGNGVTAEVIVASGGRMPADAVSSEVSLPAGMWRLTVAPVAGWGDPWALALKGALGGVFSALVGTLAYLLVDLRWQRKELVRLVALRTAEVRAREAALNRAQAIAQVGSWTAEIAADASVPAKIEWSREAFRIFGVTGDQPMSAREFIERIHPEDRARIAESWAVMPGLTGRFTAEFRIVAGQSIRWMRCQTEWEPGETVRPAHWVGTVQDITAQRLAEEELRESQERLAFALEGSNDGLWDVQLPSGGVYLSPRAGEILGYPPDELPGIAAIWSELVHPEDRAVSRAALSAYVAGAAPRFEVEQRLRTAAGGWKWVLTRGKAVTRDASGAPTRMTGTHTDISARREAEVARAESEERLRRAVIFSPLPVMIHAEDGEVVVLSEAWTEITGYARGDIPTVAAWAARAGGERGEAVLAGLRQVHQAAGKVRNGEQVIRTKSGEERIWDFSAAGFGTMSDGRRLAISAAVDVTERRRAEEALRGSLRETEALLKEVHHRVKNNLQVIASLLRLEAGRIGHPVTQGVLQDMQSRIRSMALLHETLYRSGSFAQVDLAAYLGSLCRHLFRSVGGATARPIELKLEVAPVTLAVDLAVPCGLIVSELASNCLKHGFPDGQGGEVRIALDSVAAGTHLRLRVSDTGVGLPPDFALRQERSLGLQLVGDLARQLRGHLEIGEGPAAVFEVTFPAGGTDGTAGNTRH